MVYTLIKLINFLIFQWLWIFFSPVTEFLTFFSYIFWEKYVIFPPLFCYKISSNLVFLEQTDCDTFLHETGFHLLIFCLEFCFCIHVRDRPMLLCYNVFIRVWYESYSALESKLGNVLLSGSVCVRLLLFVSFLLLFSHYVVSNSHGL